MKIWDTFILGDELDVLECRLIEYAGSLVYRHVIAEATRDHQGNPKPLYFAENKERFAPFMDRIIHIIADDLPEGDNNWSRINKQRDCISNGLGDVDPDDVIMYSDVDEIMKPEGIEQALWCAPGVKNLNYKQRHAIYCVDWEARQRWSGPVVIQQKKVNCVFHDIRYIQDGIQVEYGAGWHLSWLGGPEVILRKTTQYCHPELTKYITGNLAAGNLIEKGQYWEPPHYQLDPVEVDEEWPQWVAEHRCPDNWFRSYYAAPVDTQDLRGRAGPDFRYGNLREADKLAAGNL